MKEIYFDYIHPSKGSLSVIVHVFSNEKTFIKVVWGKHKKISFCFVSTYAVKTVRMRLRSLLNPFLRDMWISFSF